MSPAADVAVVVVVVDIGAAIVKKSKNTMYFHDFIIVLVINIQLGLNHIDWFSLCVSRPPPCQVTIINYLVEVN